MKKLLIILMVVAMASFLFVGCLPGVTPDVDDEDEEDVVVTPPVTKAPIIYNVSTNLVGLATIIDPTSTAAQYVNKAESAWGIRIWGTAPTYSEVKVYIDGIIAGTADTLAGSTWSVLITLSELGEDGAKIVHAVAKEPGKDESVKSNEVKFTLDRTPPKMTAVAAYPNVPVIGDGHYKVEFSEDVDISVDVVANTQSALNPLNWSVTMGAGANTGFVIAADTFTAVSTKVINIVPTTALTVVLPTGASYAFYCWDIEDVAGNITATAPVAPALSSAVIYGITL